MTRPSAAALAKALWLLCILLTLPAAVTADQVSTIAVEADGSIVVVDAYPLDAVIRIDPVTGATSIVSDDAVGSGLPLARPWDIAVEANGSLLVSVLGSLTPAEARLVRVDPVTGDRSTVSDDTTGTGPALLSVRSVAVAADGGVFVVDDGVPLGGVERILRVDPSTGDRSVVSDPTVGTGPALDFPNSIAVEPEGTLVSADRGLDAVMRIDPVTGDRTIVSDAAHGEGPRLTGPRGVAVEADGSIIVSNSSRERFCVTICPSEICEICLVTAPSVMRVNPPNGDRIVVSGGGSGLLNAFGDPLTPFFGRVGWGPNLVAAADVAVESEKSFVVADSGRVMRVNAVTGRRTVVADVPALMAEGEGSLPTAVPVEDSLRRLAARHDERCYRPRDPRAWLRSALGDAYKPFAARGLEDLFSGLSKAQRQGLGERLYPAVWSAMRDILGASHPDTQEAAHGLAELAKASGRTGRRRTQELASR